MRFADDIVRWYDILLIEKNSVEVDDELEECREALENKGQRISRGKSEYKKYDFGWKITLRT